MNEQDNQIKEKDINSRKELWDNLFGFINTDSWANQQTSPLSLPNLPLLGVALPTSPTPGKRWPHKDSNFLPLPGTYKLVKESIQSKLKDYDTKVTNLITTWKPYFQANIIPLLEDEIDGDKPLAFHCKRLFDHQIIGVVSHVFPDLLIFEVEFSQVKKFKELVEKLNDWAFSKEEVQKQWETDLNKMKGRINWQVTNVFWNKWGGKVGLADLAKEVNEYLELWRVGKGAKGKWKTTLANYQNQLAEVFSQKESLQISFLNFGKVKWYREGQLIVTTNNKGGWDLANPALLVFWFWQKTYRAFRIVKFNYLDINYLNVELVLEEDWTWKSYERGMVSPGTLETQKHPIYKDKDETLHYPFCEDLGQKEVYYLDTDYQPKWQLYTINKPNFVETISDDLTGVMNGEQFFANFYEHPIAFPSNIYKVERYSQFWTGLSKNDIILLLLPEDFYTGGSLLGVGNQVSNSFYETKHVCYFELATHDYTTDPATAVDPQRIQRATQDLLSHKHLIDHSSFQFCFNQESIFSANLRYLDFFPENNKWMLKYLLKIKATPAGIYYTFLSNNILWQLKLEVKQTVPSGKTLKSLLKAAMVVVTVTGAFMLAGAIGAGGAGMADGAILNSIQGDLSKLQQVNNLLEGAKSILPEQTENISYSFSLFDFWSKLRKRPFWGKIYVSNTLKNNLLHNNNQNPITYPLNITFPRLDEIIKKGDWQGELRNFYDPGKYLETKFREGVRFYEDLDKDLLKPNLGIVGINNLIVYNLGNSGGFIGEEIREWEWNEVTFDYRAEAKGYGHSTYLNVDNSTVRANEWKALNWSHWDDGKGWCWGCTQEMFSPTGYQGNAHDPNSPGCPPFPKKEVGTITPSQTCRVEMKLHVNGSNTVYETLEGGVEYKIAVDDKRIYFGSLKSSGVKLQKVAGRDDFADVDWNPMTGIGGSDINIAPNEPEINIPDPSVDNLPPDPGVDLSKEFDNKGEAEVPFVESDIILEPEPTEADNNQDFDPPVVEIDPPEPEAPEVDPPEIDPTKDLESKDDEPPGKDPFEFDPKDYE